MRGTRCLIFIDLPGIRANIKCFYKWICCAIFVFFFFLSFFGSYLHADAMKKHFFSGNLFNIVYGTQYLYIVHLLDTPDTQEKSNIFQVLQCKIQMQAYVWTDKKKRITINFVFYTIPNRCYPFCRFFRFLSLFLSSSISWP